MKLPTSSSQYFDAVPHVPRNPGIPIAGEDFFGRAVTIGNNVDRLPASLIIAPDRLGGMGVIRAALPIAVRHCGGIRPTMRKAWTVFKREGWNGVRRRIISAGRSSRFYRNNYSEWIRRYDTLTDETRAAMRASIGTFAHSPLISILMPVCGPKAELLVDAIDSVRKQIYPHWELCIAGNASCSRELRAILERYAFEDSRIRVAFGEQNLSIFEPSNNALELATGSWATIFEPDSLLAESALFWIVDGINQNPDCGLIYSDEDKIDKKGRRFAPYFKCDWNVDLFYSHNMISRLAVYRTALLREIGGLNPEMDGCRDYDLALRCIEKLKPNQIFHIPRILCHERAIAEDCGHSADFTSLAKPDGANVLNAHFQRQSVAASAEFIGHGYRVRYALPEKPPLVSVIIPTRDGVHLLRPCVASILAKTTYPNFEILIVDNGSSSRSTLRYFKKLESESRVRIVRDDQPFNFSALNNTAVKSARGDLVALLNNDIEVISPDWLSEMVSHALRPGVGAVGARLWYPNETLQHGGVILGVGGAGSHSHKHLPRHQLGYFGRASLVQNFSAVTAACMVVRKEIYEEVGGLNETELQVAFNDLDFCLRLLEAGYRNIWTPFAELYHRESATRGYENTPEKQARYAKEAAYLSDRWGMKRLNDPAYSPNLTLDRADFSPAWPPRVKPMV